ncbi:MAG: hypothetical protein IPL49_09230 [Saprospirales bacterium]|nr:hypothetical protein [Saprospirales bacterium]MBK8491055.1 hypothetical protein [Saprospirales bacterium]
MKNSVIFSAILLFGLLLASCDSKPKVIESESGSGGGSPVFPQAEMAQQPSEDQMHEVVVEEKLDTDKYSYLRVTENGEEVWIAIPLMEGIQVGNTYYYKGGLMKKNFFSKEYNRVFETLYLVSNLSQKGGTAVDEVLSNMQGQAGSVESPTTAITPAKGAIKISDLMANPQKYEGKVIKVTGKCVKVNPMIMGRNWVHLQDGSGKDMDLTITTDEVVPLGSIVTMEGTIALNQDFGAGYRYDVIMEKATVQQ